ncbi:MAG: type II toxin-antitoxin system RelE/ParE family toxin [Gammaproteobacteria bacterium]|nr:type II toxin-antitoxin system RelE/ParE family toxin [Gammaproteobacteria bacterium]
MIKSFADKRTAALFAGQRVKGVPRDFQRWARIKLLMLDAAKRLDDLRVPPGNRLEAMKGDRAGNQSIRINDRRRICFEWRAEESWIVEVVDYHRG